MVYSDRQIEAFARTQLRLSITQKPPKPYIVKLKAFLATYPNDTNFLFDMQPGTGYGRIRCKETGCHEASVKLGPDATRTGGINNGVGSFSAFETHIKTQSSHVLARQRRLQQTANASSSKSQPQPTAARTVKMEVDPMSTPPIPSSSRTKRPSYGGDDAPAKRLKTEPGTPTRSALSQRTNFGGVKPEPIDHHMAPVPILHRPAHQYVDVEGVAPPNASPSTKSRMAALKAVAELRKNLSLYQSQINQMISRGVPPDHPSVEDMDFAVDNILQGIAAQEAIIYALPPAPKVEVKAEAYNPFINRAGPSNVKSEPAVVPKPEPYLAQVPYHHPAQYPDVDYGIRDAMILSGFAPPMEVPMPPYNHYEHVPGVNNAGIDAFLIAAGNAENFEKNVTVKDALKKLKLHDTNQDFHGMNISLMAHQVLGVSWMNMQEEHNHRGGIMADEMGLGKTVQTIATIMFNPSNDKKINQTLIVGPVALLFQWKQEIERKTTTGIKVLIYHGSSRPKGKDAVKQISSYDIVLTTYGTISSEWPESEDFKERARKRRRNTVKKEDDFIVDDADDGGKKRKKKELQSPLFEIEWYRIVLDEAQNVRNKATRVSQAVVDLRARLRWCLTGTPLINGVADAYGLLRFLRIRPWHDWREFSSRIARYEKKEPNRATHTLQLVFRGCLLRRKKDSELDGQKLVELPPKTYHLPEIAFSQEEQEIYNFLQARSRAIFNKFLRQGTVLKNYTQVLVMLLRLRQCCVHPSLIAEYEDAFLRKGEIRGNGEDDEDYINEVMRAEAVMGIHWVEALKDHLLRQAKDRMAAEKESQGEASISDECPICFEPLLESAQITACKHTFCKGCLDEMFNGPAQEEAPAEGPNCRAPISKERLFLRDSFMPTDVDLGLEKPKPAKKSKGKGKAKARPIDEDGDVDIIGSSDEDDEEYMREKSAPRRSGRAAKPKIAYEVESDDSIDDFIVEDGESETEKDALRELKAKRQAKKDKAKAKAKAKSKGKMRIGSSDDKYEGSDAEEEIVEEEVDSIEVEKYDYLANIGVSQSVQKPPMLSKFLPSAKMLYMMELLEGLKEKHPDDKIIVVSQWTSALALCASYLSEKKFTHVRYEGSMNAKERAAAVDAFMDDDNVRVMLMSLKAGGVGLNLVRANHVISLDFAWSEAVEAQAFDRTHRLGQKKPVQIHRLCIPGTVEVKVIGLQERKGQIADGALGEGRAKGARLSVKELAGLFGLDARGRVIDQ